MPCLAVIRTIGRPIWGPLPPNPATKTSRSLRAEARKDGMAWGWFVRDESRPDANAPHEPPVAGTWCACALPTPSAGGCRPLLGLPIFPP